MSLKEKRVLASKSVKDPLKYYYLEKDVLLAVEKVRKRAFTVDGECVIPMDAFDEKDMNPTTREWCKKQWRWIQNK